MAGYCGLCNLEGNVGIPRPDGESLMEFREHVATHDRFRGENARMVHRASSLMSGMGPSGCWCVCHLNSTSISRQVCAMESDDRTCGFCGREGAARYREGSE
jgi:hypothetical protein